MRRPVVLLVFSLALAIGGVVVAPMASAADGPLGKVTVSADTTAKPTLDFAKPFKVTKTADVVVTPGAGAGLSKGQKITFDFVLVDGRTGAEVQSSWATGTPASLALDKKTTAPALVESLTGTKVGSRVLVGIAPEDGLAKRLSAQQVKKNDSLLFVIDVRSVLKPLKKATGEAVAPVAGLPTVALAKNGKPKITIPKGAAAPTDLVVQPLIKGSGPAVTSGQTITVHYTGVIWDTGKQFDSSWDRGTPFDTVIGSGQVIPGWDTGLVGQTVGSQVLLVVPPAQGYGATGQSAAGIKGTDTLVFVVDILDAY
jgi:peptidylprolyl isomerase